eukprot:Gregarina_sp_Pseudo_9__2201@NODE_2544_length_961_cov_48_831887_g1553_i1_p2_GENE_NODE_2544_length_961_cov_48_831887_g1553_i1NODE_2544_length_961_cov_48_831887_g1553_i1_p2_ORF_typecomplete_len128_score14_29_NODE_2544_length_961_cov_48_831887_g1553_i169452
MYIYLRVRNPRTTHDAEPNTELNTETASLAIQAEINNSPPTNEHAPTSNVSDDALTSSSSEEEGNNGSTLSSLSPSSEEFSRPQAAPGMVDRATEVSRRQTLLATSPRLEQKAFQRPTTGAKAQAPN